MNPGPMFTPLAGVDIEEAHRWYESQRLGLGDDFRASLAAVWKLLAQFPEAGPTAHRELRRVLVPHFPFAVYYRVVGRRIWLPSPAPRPAGVAAAGVTCR